MILLSVSKIGKNIGTSVWNLMGITMKGNKIAMIKWIIFEETQNSRYYQQTSYLPGMEYKQEK